ncbi:MAG: hypothetical protein KJI70_00725 [Patescibacteria group bacterium]|nr:hypothetical protein [Patescibacteria group bacterium]
MVFEDLRKKIEKQFVSKEEEKKEAPKTFDYLSVEELLNVLGLTIKSDQENKLATFLCQLSAFTEKSQFNISFNAPSSTGKSYIPLEVGKLFPKEDLIEVGYCSPTAFFHDQAKKNKDGQYVINLERKILVFLDQPHTLLLQHLRPVLSHDKKEILVKITDRSKRKLRTKNIVVRGYPSVIFCSAGLKIDEQEATRFLLLSPEISQEKIRESIIERIKKESNYKTYRKELEANPKRTELKERIESIRQTGVKGIEISEQLKETIEKEFLSRHKKFLKPRHSRDIARLISLTKAFALLNLWHRGINENKVITCKKEDFKNALKIWEVISQSQELNLPPYIFDLFNKIVLPLWIEGIVGITRQEIMNEHFRCYGRPISDEQLRREIVPMWSTAGLITQEPDSMDRRKMLIIPIQEKVESKQ